jgi:hypothetical protein
MVLVTLPTCRLRERRRLPDETFPIATTFEGGRADANHDIAIERFVTPGAPYIPGFGGENVCGTTAKVVVYVE